MGSNYVEYYLHLANLICIYLILGQGANVSFGLGRLFSLAHVAMYAVGAYATAILSTEYGSDVWVCLAASLAVGAFFGYVLGKLTLRLSTDYLAIGTLAFSFVVSAVLINWRSVTRGVLGIPGIPDPIINGRMLIEGRDFLAFAASVTFLTLAFLWCVFRSPWARKLRAYGERPEAAAAMGVPGTLVATTSLVISGGCAGIAGSLFAYYLNFIDPSSFSLSEMIFILTILIVGRPGSFWGVIGSTVFLVLLPEPLRWTFQDSPSILGPMRQLLYAVVLFAVVAINRHRIFPVVRVI